MNSIAKLKPLALLAALAVATPAAAQTVTVSQTVNWTNIWNWLYPTWKCVKADGSYCGTTEMSNPYYKQVVILSTGFADSERPAFWADFDKTVSLITQPGSAGSSWSVQRASQLLFIGYFVAGGPLGAPDAVFGASIAPHPIRGYALSLSQQAVYAKIDAIRLLGLRQLRPFGAACSSTPSRPR